MRYQASMALKVSKPTFDVLFADNDELSFNSDIATHSIFNIVTLQKNPGSTQVVFNHNLGFAPKVWLYVEADFDGSGTIKMGRAPRVIQPYGMDENYVDYYITSTQLVVQSYYSYGTYTFRAIIFTRSPKV